MGAALREGLWKRPADAGDVWANPVAVNRHAALIAEAGDVLTVGRTT